jgi:hypothetical protein
MRNFKLYLVPAIMLVCCVAAFGQQPPPSAPDAQAEFRAAQEKLTEKSRALEAAQLDFNAAAARYEVTIYKLMAEAGVKPSECGTTATPFACVKSDPATGRLTFEKKAQAPQPPDDGSKKVH